MNLRKLAQNKRCQVRLPGICNHNIETTVLAHLRLADITGAGMKAPDLLGAWCCSSCHTETEQKKADDEIQRAFLEGIMRTQSQLIEMGLLKW